MFDFSLPADLHDPKWFVLFVRSNQEKRIAQRLREGEVEHFLPCCRSLRQWKDRRVILEMPLFPGYVFVRLPFPERAKVLTLPNVVSLIGSKNSPSVVSEDEINRIKTGIAHGNAMPHAGLAVGQRVRIIAGALSGMEGVLLRCQNAVRIVICIESISRSFVVEVDRSAVEPLLIPMPVYLEGRAGGPDHCLIGSSGHQVIGPSGNNPVLTSDQRFA